MIYHGVADSTKDDYEAASATELADFGFMRIVYMIILLSHIDLAIVVVPLILLALHYAISEKLIST